ncbi:MAG: lysophospholipase [Planctomycetes bacterium]|nr:lysophospholipase [Planctomycetota bacterium]
MGLLVTILFTFLSGDTVPRIVALGDSITRGERAGVKATQTFPAQLHKTLSKDGVATVVLNLGVGGQRTDQAIKRLAEVAKYKPKIVTIMYGTNDSYVDVGAKEPRITADEYRKNLTTLVKEFRKVGTTPILMTPPRWGDKAKANGIGEHPNVKLEAYVKVCREVARETNTPLVDHFAHWTKANADGTDVGAWTTDQCHPNATGHREIVRLLAPIVREALK